MLHDELEFRSGLDAYYPSAFACVEGNRTQKLRIPNGREALLLMFGTKMGYCIQLSDTLFKTSHSMYYESGRIAARVFKIRLLTSSNQFRQHIA